MVSTTGDPHHSLFPFCKVEFEVPSIVDPDPVPAWRAGSGASQTFTAYKNDSEAEPSVLNLRSAFQYTHGAGSPEARDAVTELTNLFHAPPNHFVALTVGNADGVTKAFRLLGERGDYFLTEEFSFPGMTNAPLSYGIKWIPVKMDNGGLIPEDMERILKGWNEDRGRRPHVLYTVP